MTLLAELHLDHLVTIPDAEEGDNGTRKSAVLQHFYASDGWTIRRTAPGEYSVHRFGMKRDVHVSGIGATYTGVEVDHFYAPAEEPAAAPLPEQAGQPDAPPVDLEGGTSPRRKGKR